MGIASDGVLACIPEPMASAMCWSTVMEEEMLVLLVTCAESLSVDSLYSLSWSSSSLVWALEPLLPPLLPPPYCSTSGRAVGSAGSSSCAQDMLPSRLRTPKQLSLPVGGGGTWSRSAATRLDLRVAKLTPAKAAESAEPALDAPGGMVCCDGMYAVGRGDKVARWECVQQDNGKS